MNLKDYPQVVIKVKNVSKVYQLSRKSTNILDLFQNKKHKNLLKNKKVKNIKALDNLSLEVKQGEVLGILGDNGAGKSTLLKVISKITQPTKGEVQLKGRVASLLEVGAGFHNDLIGLENIILNGNILGMSSSEIQRQLKSIISFAGIDEAYLYAPIKYYSTGMRTRLAFAIGAHLEGDILLVDEILSVGDFSFQQKCLNKINEISAKKQRTVLITSHNLAIIKRLCNRVILLEKGAMIRNGHPDSVIQEYINRKKIEYQANVQPGIFQLYNGNSPSFFKMIKVYSGTQLSNTHYSGKSLRFEVDYSGNYEFKELLFGFVIKNSFNQAMISVNNKHLATLLETNSPTEGKIIVEIEKLLLFGQGVYWVDLYIGDFDDRMEKYENAFNFKLLQSDVYQSGNFLWESTNQFYQPDLKIYCE